MAKASFSCAQCGASIDVGGAGYNRARADSYAAYCEKRGDICRSCAQAKFAADNQAAVAASQTAGLPALTGSEKQVAWANTIRLQALPHVAGGHDLMVHEMSDMCAVQCLDASVAAELHDAVALLASELRQQLDAKFWIDRMRAASPQVIQSWMRDELNRRLRTIAPSAYAAAMARRAERAERAAQPDV